MPWACYKAPGHVQLLEPRVCRVLTGTYWHALCETSKPGSRECDLCHMTPGPFAPKCSNLARGCEDTRSDMGPVFEDTCVLAGVPSVSRGPAHRGPGAGAQAQPEARTKRRPRSPDRRPPRIPAGAARRPHGAVRRVVERRAPSQPLRSPRRPLGSRRRQRRWRQRPQRGRRGGRFGQGRSSSQRPSN